MPGETLSPRPSLAPTTWIAAGLWSGVWCAEAATWSVAAPRVWAAVLSVLCVLAAAFAWRRIGLASAVALSVVAGSVIGSVYWVGVDARSSSLQGEAGRRFEATVVTDARFSPSGTRSEVVVGSGRRATRLSVVWPRGCVPEFGRTVRVYGRAARPSRDEYGRRLRRAGVAATVRARHAEVGPWCSGLRGGVAAVRAEALHAIGAVRGAGSDLVAGVVAGDRRGMAGTQAESDFRATGLSHLIAVSGSHLVVVAALVGWLMRTAGVSRRATLTACAGVAGLYVLFTGVQPSAVRALIMGLIASAASMSGRRAHAGAGLGAAVLVSLAVWPPSAFDIGFQLSVAAVAGLVVFAPLARAWLQGALPLCVGWLAEPLALTLTAQLATLPVTTSTFGTLSTISPIANLLVGPIITAAMLLGLIGATASFMNDALGRLALVPAAACGAVSVWIAGRLAAVPGAVVPLAGSTSAVALAVTATGIAAWAAWPRPRVGTARAALAAAAVVAMLWLLPRPAPAGTSLVVLDVGQGDAILVRDEDKTMLVDTGPDDEALRAALVRHRVRRIDTLVLTHTHADHTGGTPALASGFAVGSVIVARGAKGALSPVARKLRAPITEVSAGDSWRTGAVSAEVLAPRGAVLDPGANDSCVVIRIARGEFSALLTGDAEADVLEYVARDSVQDGITALKVGHHGSADAVSVTAMEALKPTVAIVSVGRGNSYGHPAPSTIEMLERAGTRVVRTDQLGDIGIEFDERSWRLVVAVDGAAAQRCAKLIACRPDTANRWRGAHEREHRGSQAHLPRAQRAGVLGPPGPRSPPSARCQRGGSRLQLRDVRRGARVRRCDRRCVQHPAVRLRAPPRRREGRGQAAEGRR